MQSNRETLVAFVIILVIATTSIIASQNTATYTASLSQPLTTGSTTTDPASLLKCQCSNYMHANVSTLTPLALSVIQDTRFVQAENGENFGF